MEHYKNLSFTENIVEEYNGIIYTEEWLPIHGYNHKYYISSFGRVKSLIQKNRPKILKQSICCGYLRVDLVTKTNHNLVHILVSKAFIPNPENKPQVNHIRGVRTDNRFHQLEWSTYSEQQLHAHKILGFKPNISGLLVKIEKQKTKINKISPETNKIICSYQSQQDACRELGLDKDAIYRVLKKRQELAGGFKWEYA